jgi:hypothetical protein
MGGNSLPLSGSQEGKTHELPLSFHRNKSPILTHNIV